MPSGTPSVPHHTAGWAPTYHHATAAHAAQQQQHTSYGYAAAPVVPASSASNNHYAAHGFTSPPDGSGGGGGGGGGPLYAPSSTSPPVAHVSLPSSRSFEAGAIRNRAAAAAAAGRGDEEALLPQTPNADKGSLSSSKSGRSCLGRVRRQIRKAASTLRKLSLKQWIVGLICGCSLLILIRFLLHHYLDRGKYSSFTIVSLVRDMSPEALAADRTSYAFQYTALQSWANLVSSGNILVFADNAEQCGYIQAEVRGIQCLPIPCWHAELNKPLLDCIFSTVHSQAPTDLIVYANADVALYSDLADAIESAAAQKDKFVMVGRRTNTLVSPVMLEDYRSPSFPARLRAHALKSGQLHSAMGIDMFVYRKKVLQTLVIRNSATGATQPAAEAAAAVSDADGLVAASGLAGPVSFPPFLAGVFRWDNWLLSQLILDDSVSVIDVTSHVLIVHQSKGKAVHEDTTGASYNDQLAKSLSGSHYKIGTIDNAGYILEGPCVRSDPATSGATAGLVTPSCLVSANPNVTDVVLFTKKASSRGYLVILTVNHNYINLALNWVCWAERIKFTNYILIAEDHSSASNFKKRGVAVIVRANAPWIKKAGDYGSVEFQETMTFRTEFLMDVLHAGFHFVTADMDGLWLDDPIPFFNDAADLQGQMHKVTKISGGLVIVRATTYGRYFWNMVIECQRANAAFLATAKPGSYVPATYTEQYCINQLSLKLASQPLFSRSLLDPYLFPDGKSFFDERQSQFRGVWPSIIHNNWIMGTSNKIKRLQDWNLQSADAERGECIALQTMPQPRLPHDNPVRAEYAAMRAAQPPAPPVDVSKLQSPKAPVFDPPPYSWSGAPALPFDFKIRVLASFDGGKLQALLDSLSATDFEGDGPRITLEISIDHPPPTPDEALVRGWNQVNTIALNYKWNADVPAAVKARAGGAGEKVVIEQPYALGSIGQFLRSWSPSSDTDNQLILLVDSSMSLAPGWYKWAKRALLKYYAHPDQYDPRLMGISLSSQGMILGETHVQRFGSSSGNIAPPQPNDELAFGVSPTNPRTPFDVLNSRSQYFKSQTFTDSNRAEILFPQHWRAFQAWLESKKVDTLSGTASSGATPCVPTLVSNKWFNASPSRHWYQWINRFVFEEGYYFLYTNFGGEGGQPRSAFAHPTAMLQNKRSPSAARLEIKLVNSVSLACRA